MAENVLIFFISDGIAPKTCCKSSLEQKMIVSSDLFKSLTRLIMVNQAAISSCVNLAHPTILMQQLNTNTQRPSLQWFLQLHFCCTHICSFI